MPSGKAAGQGRIGASGWAVPASTVEIYTIFEGASEIQRLVIARAISGMRSR
jgi:alkylation response protein AidB-like acyl-CoA dehydrogenase